MIVVQGRVRNALLRVVNALTTLLVPQAKAPPRPKAPRVLIVRCDNVGDAVLSTAPLQAIRDALEPACMDVLCNPHTREIFENHSAVDAVLIGKTPWWMVRERTHLWQRLKAWAGLPRLVLQLRKRHYDIGIDLRGDLRQFVFFFAATGIPERISNDRTGGRNFLTTCVAFSGNQHEVERMALITSAIGGSPSRRPHLVAAVLGSAARGRLGLPDRYVAIAAKGTSANREWPAEHIAHLAEQVNKEFGIPLVHVGATADVSHAEDVQRLVRSGYVSLVERTTLKELSGVLAAAEVVVAMDSGPMHIAAAVGVPLIVLWGPGGPDLLPISDRVTIMRATVPCKCSGMRKCRMASGPGRCFTDISPVEVVDAIRVHLSRAVISAVPTPQPCRQAAG